MVDEANIETHGFQMLGQAVGWVSHQPDWKGCLLSRAARMLERDKNFPSVIGWSLGNESGMGPGHEAMAAWLRARDPRRPVQYESGGSCTSVTDIICPMYKVRCMLWVDQPGSPIQKMLKPGLLRRQGVLYIMGGPAWITRTKDT